jgi:hypothetical protein
MPFKNYRDESRTQWGAEVDESYTISREQIGLGCLLRIADATEAMAEGAPRQEHALFLGCGAEQQTMRTQGI